MRSSNGGNRITEKTRKVLCFLKTHHVEHFRTNLLDIKRDAESLSRDGEELRQ